MARVRIKHPARTHQVKEKLLEILAKKKIYAVDIKETRDGFAVITATEAEIDAIFTNDCTEALRESRFTPILPLQLKAQRTVLLFNLDSHIHGKEKEVIQQEIEDQNDFAQNAIDNIFKFPKARIIKITFKTAKIATKATEQGLLLFHMRVPHYQIKKEEFIPITCMKCYEMESHFTNKCPKDRSYKVCSECGSEDHTWNECKEENKKCLNVAKIDMS